MWDVGGYCNVYGSLSGAGVMCDVRPGSEVWHSFTFTSPALRSLNDRPRLLWLWIRAIYQPLVSGPSPHRYLAYDVSRAPSDLPFVIYL